MEFRFHGGAMEVGRSCIELITQKRKYLLDAGIEISDHGSLYPSKIENLYEVHGVFLSHGHLDHVGALPLLKHFGLNSNIFATPVTRAITKILLNDSLHIAQLEKENIAYKKRDVKQIMTRFKNIEYDKMYAYDNILFKFFSAGHIPGSSSILINTEGNNILYTGDINTSSTNLLNSANAAYGRINVLITESTYGNRDHPNKEKEEERFISEIFSTLNNHGKVLVAAFAVSRSQEIMMMLNKYNFDVPIYIDGMARSMTELFLDYPEYLRDAEELKDATNNVHFITSNAQRERIMQEQCIIISPSGMVSGGPIMHYLPLIINDEHSSLMLTGYQCEGTNGRRIMETGRSIIDGFEREVRCDVHKFDFSAHAGRSELQTLIKNINPEVLIIQHGDPDAVKELGEWGEKQGICTITPDYDDFIKI